MDASTKRLRRTIQGIVLASFAVELLLAEAWLRLGRGSSIAGLLHSDGLEVPLVAGLALGLATALASRVFFSTLARDLTREIFVPLLGRTTNADLLLLSVLPGLGEETLFRGVLQPEIGLPAASIVFGLLHSGLSRQLLPYGLWAALVGGVLGALYMVTGSLWGCIVAHALINALGIGWMRRLTKTAKDSTDPTS